MLQDIKGTLQEGEAKIKSASQQGEKVMLHTSSQGQINLRHELASLGQEWDVLVAKVNDTQQGLLQAIRGFLFHLLNSKINFKYRNIMCFSKI